jgi:hypothetical protein
VRARGKELQALLLKVPTLEKMSFSFYGLPFFLKRWIKLQLDHAVEEETDLSQPVSCFAPQQSDGNSAEKLLFLLPTGSNLDGERNIRGTARLFQTTHIMEILTS